MRHDLSDPGDDDDRQRVVVRVDLVSGPFAPAAAERVLQVILGERGRIGAEVTKVRVELRGSMASRCDIAHGASTAVLTKSCRAERTERCRRVCRQRGRQQRALDAETPAW